MTRFIYLAIGVLVGAVGMAAAGRAAPQDPVKTSPQLYTVRLDNERVRVLEYRLKPGEKEPMHSHEPGLVIVLNAATTKTTLPDGRVTEGTSTAGAVNWRAAPMSHALENVGTTDMHNFAIDVKPCGR